MTPPPEGETQSSAAESELPVEAFGADMDEIEDLEEEEEEEKEEETDPATLYPPPSPSMSSEPSLVSQITPARTMANVREVRERAVAAVIETDEEFQSFLQAFDDTNKSHKISIHRREPKKYKGLDIEGFLADYSRPVTLQEMKEEYGGGTFEIYITGRLAPDSNRRGQKAKVLVKISGLPLVQQEAPAGGEGAWAKELVKDTMAAAEREKQALRETMREVKEEAREASNKLEERMSQMLLAQQTAGKMSPDEIKLQLEREKSEREERAAERAIEREDRQRREDQAIARDQIHQKEMVEMQMKMAQMQTDSRQEMARMQLDAANNQNKMMQTFMANKNDDKTLAFMQSSMDQRQTQTEANQKFLLDTQRQASQTQMEQMSSLQSAKDQFFANALKAQNKGGGLADMIAMAVQLKEMNGLFGGGGDEDKGLAQQVLEGAKDLIPSLGAAAQAFRGPPSVMSNPSAPPQQQALPPGTVAEVELPPEPGGAGREAEGLMQLTPEERKQARLRRRQARKEVEARYGTGPAPQESTPTPEVLEPEPQPEPPQAPQAAAEQTLTVGEDFVKAPADRQLEVAEEFQMLGHNVEVALRKDVDAQDFYADHVQLSDSAKTFIKEVTGEQCVEFLSMQVPPDWRIRTPLGARFVRTLHAYLTAES